jgi:hypothetical protein
MFCSTILKPNLENNNQNFFLFQSINFLLRNPRIAGVTYHFLLVIISYGTFIYVRCTLILFLSCMIMHKNESSQIIHLEHHSYTWIDSISTYNWLLSGSIQMIYISIETHLIIYKHWDLTVWHHHVFVWVISLLAAIDKKKKCLIEQ